MCRLDRTAAHSNGHDPAQARLRWKQTDLDSMADRRVAATGTLRHKKREIHLSAVDTRHLTVVYK